jgi:hypothetical protein
MYVCVSVREFLCVVCVYCLMYHILSVKRREQLFLNAALYKCTLLLLLLDEKPLGKIENTLRTVEKIHRLPTVATRHTKHNLRYRRAVIWPVPPGN